MNEFSSESEYANCVTGVPATQLILLLERNFKPVQNPWEPPTVWKEQKEINTHCRKSIQISSIIKFLPKAHSLLEDSISTVTQNQTKINWKQEALYKRL